jgi:protease-4
MHQILKQTLALLLAFAVALTALFLGLFLVFALAAAGSKPSVPKGAVLMVDLARPLTERGGSPDALALLGGETRFEIPAHEAAAAVRHAAQDGRIRAVVLHGGIAASVAELDALREALGEVRAARKPVLAYYGSGDEKTLWLASAADEWWMEPLGILVVDGWGAEIPYFGDLFEKYGIGVQVTRVGKYKSAVEPFILDHMSAENREQIAGILADVQAHVFGGIAKSRGVEAARLEELMRTEGFVDAQRAVELGLATRAAPFGEFLARLRAITDVDDDEEIPQIGLEEYALAVRKSHGKGDALQVIVAEGDILDGSHPDGIGGDELAHSLREARLDDDVKAVVLRVNSPGGSATASDVIRSELRALKAAGKKVVVSMGRVAASGGYWISADADLIVAQPETITGSIGVFGMLPNVQELAERHGLRGELVGTGPLVGIESIWRAKDATQIARVQSLVDQIYERFLDLVAEGRGLTRERVHEIAQGRVWSGVKAKELRLVDELGGLERAIELARERAGLAADAPVRYEREEPGAIEALIEEALRGEPERLARSIGAELAPFKATLAALERLQRMSGPSGVLARMPFDLAIE